MQYNPKFLKRKIYLLIFHIIIIFFMLSNTVIAEIHTRCPCTKAVEKDSLGNDILGIDSIRGTAFDVTVLLGVDPKGSERSRYAEVIYHWADAVCEQTNGAHRLRNVRIFIDGKEPYISNEEVDVFWPKNPDNNSIPRPYAAANGFGYIHKKIYMLVSHQDGNIYTPNWEKVSGYTLGHEWGHYAYCLFDEYQDKTHEFSKDSLPSKIDEEIDFSIMNNQTKAIPADATSLADYRWLNHSSINYINPSTSDTYNNAQGRVYGASGWDILTKMPDKDELSHVVELKNKTRDFYKDLIPRKPTNGEILIELSDDTKQEECRKLVNVVWMDDTNNPNVCDPPFSDISYDHPYSQFIYFMRHIKIIEGYFDSTKFVNEKETIQRDEFCKLTIETAEMLGMNFTEMSHAELADTFKDIHLSDPQKWFEPYIGKLYLYGRTDGEEGVISGYPDGTFKPEQPINYAEIYKVIMLTFFKEDYRNFQNNNADILEGTAWFIPCIKSSDDIQSNYQEGLSPILDETAAGYFRKLRFKPDHPYQLISSDNDRVSEPISRQAAVKLLFDVYQHKLQEKISSGEILMESLGRFEDYPYLINKEKEK